ncbi:MAG: A/G-specific adenine glycosylase [Sandaracinaceae bacterium]|nr:A/G-specific adenine glycosylase [Sandaracinaceae bacterium]
MLREALLAWYDANKRDLPWRRTRDPYAVWVSEVMLQQTRVETVIPYWERFLARFPSAASLAEASEDEVLASWSGLGYYRRARLLHAGVREVVERYGGEVPEDPALRRGLPGVGRYTAGAIGSICFDREEPIVDGNVARVLSRAFAIEHPLGSSASERALWERAGELVRGERPGELNQALMELGARVCTPRSPSCEGCPIASWCAARAGDRVGELPVPKKRREPLRVGVVAVVAARADGAVALARGERALFGGLYAPPMTEGRGREAALTALRFARVRARVEAEPAGALEHVLSHRVLDVEVWRASRPSTRACRVVAPSELSALGVSALTRRILAAAQGVG